MHGRDWGGCWLGKSAEIGVKTILSRNAAVIGKRSRPMTGLTDETAREKRTTFAAGVGVAGNNRGKQRPQSSR